MVSHGASLASMKDPFSSPPMPKSFYHPTRSRGVDSTVAITAPERDHLTDHSEADARFLHESATLLPHFKSLQSQKHQKISIDHNASTSKSNDHFRELWPESEQPSLITVPGDISPFTSVSAEAEHDNGGRQNKAEYNNQKYSSRKEPFTVDKTPTKSVLQKYIDRFRHSEPKSRSERANESRTSYHDFWWLNSSPSSPADNNAKPNKKQLPASNVPDRAVPFERKLTKEAVMELDQETSKLQRKADQVLSRSQLSLASSGPIVSTQGLGSSTTVSEYSLKSDNEVPYRPVFINIRDHQNLSDAEDTQASKDFRSHQVFSEISSPPDDILAKWRLRRKMEESKSSTRTAKPVAFQGVFRNKEMNLKLEEFRKKLLSQRALVTPEEIQYERQKMNLLIEEEIEKKSDEQVKLVVTQERKIQTLANHEEDPILLRLKNITGSREARIPSHSCLSNVNPAKFPQNGIKIQEEGRVPLRDNNLCGERDSNLNNACLKQDNGFTGLEKFESLHSSLNKNNTAISAEDDDDSISKRDPVMIDQLDPVILCDPNVKTVALNQSGALQEDDNRCKRCKIRTNSISSHVSNKDVTSKDISAQQSKVSGNDNFQRVFPSQSERLDQERSDDHENSASSLQGRQSYHQYLIAEKPSVEVTGKEQSEDEMLSEKSEHSANNIKSKQQKGKKCRKNLSQDLGDKEKRIRNTEREHAREGASRVGEDENCRSSRRSSISSTKSGNCEPVTKMTANVPEVSKIHDQSQLESKSRDRSSSCIKASSRSHSPSVRDTEPIQQLPMKVADVNPSPSPGQKRIQKAVIQTVTDHLFDGPSLISSVDSWASLFPQSPAPHQTMHDSDVASPLPNCCDARSLQGTPNDYLTSHGVTDYIETNASSQSDNEFDDDPLLCLLRKQRQEYVKKLEIIETALLNMDR